MGWYSDFIVQINLNTFDENVDNIHDKVREFIEKIQNKEFVKNLCIEKKLEFDEEQCCTNLTVEYLEHTLLLTTILKRAYYDSLISFVKIIKYILPQQTYTGIEGSVNGVAEGNDEYNRIKYNALKDTWRYFSDE